MVHPGWVAVQNSPDASRKGSITGIYYLGTWLSYVFVSHTLSDLLGRRYAAMAGSLVSCLGAALQASCTGSSAFATMVMGRIVSGVGVAIISTTVPLYQRYGRPARIAQRPPRRRC